MNWSLPQDSNTFKSWRWEQIRPYYEDLEKRPLNENNILTWLQDWSQLIALVQETFAHIDNAVYTNAADETTQALRQQYFREICQPAWEADENLKTRWADSGLAPPGYEKQFANLAASGEKHWPANQPLEAEENELVGKYYRSFFGAQMEWEGETISRSTFPAAMRIPDRTRRQTLWEAWNTFMLRRKDEFETIWTRLVEIRHQMAQNAGFPNYIAYRWHVDGRDYPVETYQLFQNSIAKAVTPAAAQIYEKYLRKLGVETLRPWDLLGGYTPPPPLGTSRLRPFETIPELVAGVSRIFHRLDPQLGEYFDILDREGYLDLAPRPGKNPGGNTRLLALSRRGLVSMGATGTHDDVWILIHEVGHAFSVFETTGRTAVQIMIGGHGGGEWAEFASQTMEYLTLPYMAAREGGFYSDADAALAVIDRLQGPLLFLPRCALVDHFEHWVYTHPEAGKNPEQCRAKWQALRPLYIPEMDWRGYEHIQANDWLASGHIPAMPLYFASYGISLLGSLQLWQRAQTDPAGAIAAYRRGLQQGGLGLPIPELFKAAGVTLQLDVDTIQDLTDLLKNQIAARE